MDNGLGGRPPNLRELFRHPVWPPAPPLRAGSGIIAIATNASFRALAILFMLTALGLLAVATPSVGQSAAGPIPENAHPRSYGDGWECDVSYRAEGDGCALVVVPQNAFATKQTYGPGWACLRGYEAAGGDVCVEIAVPAGGFLVPAGDRWRCLRGYRQVAAGCELIVLPEHAYLSDGTYGSDWVCERGYQATAAACLPIDVPEHAFLNTTRYGQPWTCERGYVEANGRCDAVVVPANAYFDDLGYGTRWKCERGFEQVGETCAPLVVPANAHLDRSGNRWDCNRNFQRSKGLCLLRD